MEAVAMRMPRICSQRSFSLKRIQLKMADSTSTPPFSMVYSTLESMKPSR